MYQLTKIRWVIVLPVNEVLKSYRYLVDDGIFLNDSGVNLAPGIFYDRYINLFKELQALLGKYNLLNCCTVNEELLWRAVLDYFADIARMKAFHEHNHIQVDKIIAYETYWLLRNHPIQIDKPDIIDYKYVHINEYILSYFFIKKLAKRLDKKFNANIQIDDLIDKFEDHELSDEFRKKLYYTFRFRPYTQQSLLLLVEGFITAAEFTLQVT